MSRVLRDIALQEAALQLEVPGQGRRDQVEPRIYTERDLSDAVRAASQRARENAAQEVETYVRRLDSAVHSALDELSQVLAEVERYRIALLSDLSVPVVELALGIARRVVGQEVALHPERVAHVVNDLLGELQDAERITVRVAPSTLETLRERGAAVPDDRVRWVADASLGPADARVDSDRGGYDASVSARWETVERALRESRVSVLSDLDPDRDPDPDLGSMDPERDDPREESP